MKLPFQFNGATFPMLFQPLIRILIVCLGTLFSPTWYLVHVAVNPYVDLKAVLTNNPAQVYPALLAQLKLVDPSILLFYLIPSLIGCLLVSIGYLYLCNKAGDGINRYLTRRCQSAAWKRA